MTIEPKTNRAYSQPAFFGRPADVVARDLLGKLIVRCVDGNYVRLPVTETEAYLGTHDLASHSARGRTPRTEVMFGPPGVLYVYLVYGLHWMLNIVTGAVGHAGAVLIRTAGDITGPGKLARALAITGDLNGRSAAPRAGLWFEDADGNAARRTILVTPRIGVDYAGPRWSSRKLRFVLRR